MNTKNYYRDIADDRAAVGNTCSLATSNLPESCPILPPNGGGAVQVTVASLSGCIKPCKATKLSTRVCKQFAQLSVWFSPKSASSIEITSYKIGCDDLMVNCDSMSAEFFSCCENDRAFASCWVRDNSEICIGLESTEEDDDIVANIVATIATCNSC